MGRFDPEWEFQQLDSQNLKKIIGIAVHTKKLLLNGIALLRRLEEVTEDEEKATTLAMIHQLGQLTLVWDEVEGQVNRLLIKQRDPDRPLPQIKAN